MTTHCPKCNSENLDDSKFCKECGTQLIASEGVPLQDAQSSFTKTLKAPTPLSTGKTIAGKYKILKEVGRGGMGVVYKAQDTRLDRTVALKFLSSELTRDEDAKKRFIHEAKAAAALDHPNICTVYEVEEADEQTFIAMSYLEGKSLKDRIKSGPLGIDEALEIATQVAEGLREAHAKGIVHRDIKPANIMLTAKGQAKITDFGLAKLSWGADLTKTSAVMGTVAYMSPEQAKGEAVDHRTDIWSFGVVLHEMLTGALPFKGEHEQSLMYAIMNQEPPPLIKGRPGIPKEIENIVHTALAKNLNERYQSFEDVLGDLQAVSQGLKPIKAKRRATKARIFGLKKVHFYAGLTALATLIAASMLLFLPGQGEVLDSIAILPLINDSGDPSQDYFANSLTDRLIAEFYKVSALRVASRQAVMAYAKTTKSPQQIAQELNVKAIVEASVLKSGNKVRLIARLIDPKRNQQLWGDTLEREYSDILFLQSDLAQAIVKGIKVAVEPNERLRLAIAQKVIPEAYDLCLKGINEWLAIVDVGMSPKEGRLKAKGYLEKAITIDSTLALPYAMLSIIYWELRINQQMSDKEALAESKKAALKALDLDKNHAQAIASLAAVKWADWDFSSAEKDYIRAIELEPGNNTIKFLYYSFLAWGIGRFEEAVNGQMQLLKDPSFQKVALVQRPMYYLLAGRYDDAIEAAKEAINTGQDNHIWLTIAYALKGMYTEALYQMENFVATLPGAQDDPFKLMSIACILALSGQRETALNKLEDLKAIMAPLGLDSSYETACVLAALGDKDKAFQFLNQAYESHHPYMLSLKSDFWLHSLHDDPRFQDLVKKVGFPEVRNPE